MLGGFRFRFGFFVVRAKCSSYRVSQTKNQQITVGALVMSSNAPLLSVLKQLIAPFPVTKSLRPCYDICSATKLPKPQKPAFADSTPSGSKFFSKASHPRVNDSLLGSSWMPHFRVVSVRTAVYRAYRMAVFGKAWTYRGACNPSEASVHVEVNCKNMHQADDLI